MWKFLVTGMQVKADCFSSFGMQNETIQLFFYAYFLSWKDWLFVHRGGAYFSRRIKKYVYTYVLLMKMLLHTLLLPKKCIKRMFILWLFYLIIETAVWFITNYYVGFFVLIFLSCREITLKLKSKERETLLLGFVKILVYAPIGINSIKLVI